jgi:bacillithiol system protein YtxJ
MSWFSKKEIQANTKVNWLILDSENQLATIKDQSNEQPVAIFKHSTRCSISSMAKTRLEREWDLNDNEIKIYYLDLITYRSVSNAIEEYFGVEHQSPQLILIKNGEVIFHNSHSGIAVSDIKNKL